MTIDQGRCPMRPLEQLQPSTPSKGETYWCTPETTDIRQHGGYTPTWITQGEGYTRVVSLPRQTFSIATWQSIKIQLKSEINVR